MKNNQQPSCNNDFEQDAIKVSEALQSILQKTHRLTAYKSLPLRDSLNSVLFEDIKSPLDVPGCNNSAMDGYAVAGSQLPNQDSRQYSVAGTAYAGKPFTGDCQQNECVRIMTGAMLPAHTDTIVIQEDVKQLDSGLIEIAGGHKKNQNVRFAGEDIKKGDIVLSAGSTIKPADLGVLASLGINEVRVVRKPRVCFFSTGDELKSPGEPLATGEIYDSNRYSLYGLLSKCNVDVIDMGVIKDDPDSIQQALISAANCADVVITSGGVSVGEADYIKGILQEIGDMDFWKILMKPGRPLTFGHINDSLFFGLPGNPVAVMVTFLQFVLPCLKKLAGVKSAEVMSFKARCQSVIRKNPGRTEYQRGIAGNDGQGKLRVSLTGRQGSGILTSMSQANCFIVLPEQQGKVKEGDEVMIQFLGDYFEN